MTIYGVDIHPTFQAGINIEQIAREGFSYVCVKASQGTSSSWADGAAAWAGRAEAAGMVGFVYHWLTGADPAAQVRTAKAAARGRAVMLDVEESPANADTARRFCAEAAAVGLPVPLLYLPRWYWSGIGSPTLAGLPPLVASHYVSGTGYASSLYANVPGSWWDGYGDGAVAVLQFSDRAQVAGYQIDADAFGGTIEDLRALIYRQTPPPPPPPPPGPAFPTLYEGDVSALIWRLQLFMNRAFAAYSNIDAGPGPTSRLGPQSVAALTEFQRRVGIPTAPPFAVGPRTWGQLQDFGFR